ncbi:MAG TPA: M50 family metallopeptidase [Clostridia bacterium]|nr:M50 family metallopeptidase [Clostridia bacterium]
MKIKIHPLFFLLALVLILLGQAITFVCTFIAVLLHEMSHALVARARGYRLREIVLLPYGAVLFGEESIERTSSVLIALAGPVANGVLALFTLASWWLFPSTYGFTEPFLWANVTIGAFNLLPAFPLDGSRVVLGLCKNKPRALKGLRIFGIVLALISFGLFIASAFYAINFTLGLIGIFLFLGATFGTEKEMYFHISDREFKNYNEGICERVVHISTCVSLLYALKFINSKYITTFVAVSKDGKTVKKITEDEMRKLLECNPLKMSLNEAIDNPNKLLINEAINNPNKVLVNEVGKKPIKEVINKQNKLLINKAINSN